MISINRSSKVHKTEFDCLPNIEIRLLALPSLLRVSQVREEQTAHMKVTCPILPVCTACNFNAHFSLNHPRGERVTSLGLH